MEDRVIEILRDIKSICEKSKLYCPKNCPFNIAGIEGSNHCIFTNGEAAVLPYLWRLECLRTRAEKVDNAVKDIKVYCESREKCNGCRFDGGDRCEVQNIVSKDYKRS